MSIYSAVKSLAADQGKSIYKIEHDLNRYCTLSS